MIRGSLSVSRTLATCKFKALRPGEQVAWSGGGVVLICAEVQPRANGELHFCILEGYDASKNAAESAKDGLESVSARNACEKSALFALVGAVPEKSRQLLLRRVQDAASVQRRFVLALNAFNQGG